MKAYQQTKSLECETSLISSKEVAEKGVTKLPKRKTKVAGNCKGLLYWMCIKLSTMTRDTYLFPALTES